MEEFIKNDKKVFVNCMCGVSRSSATVIGYLMYSERLSYYKAKDHVQGKREQICPNDGFKIQLMMLEEILVDFFNGNDTLD